MSGGYWSGEFPLYRSTALHNKFHVDYDKLNYSKTYSKRFNMQIYYSKYMCNAFINFMKNNSRLYEMIYIRYRKF